jgi:hypothetical protein
VSYCTDPSVRGQYSRSNYFASLPYAAHNVNVVVQETAGDVVLVTIGWTSRIAICDGGLELSNVYGYLTRP